MSAHARLLALASAVVLGSALAAGPVGAAPAIPMNGGQEPEGGDTNGHGTFTYSIDGTTFCWTVSWKKIAEPSAGHVHVAPRRAAGGVVIDLNADGVGGPDTAGCRTITSQLADAITNDPKAYYVNLHNSAFPAGAIRGQLK